MSTFFFLDYGVQQTPPCPTITTLEAKATGVTATQAVEGAQQL